MRITEHLQRARGIWFAAAFVTFFFVTTSSLWTQMPPSGVLMGPTIAASLRNAADATKSQAIIVQNAAQSWARRANSASYRIENCQADLSNTQVQFLGLRERFNWMGSLALEAKRPNANNAVAELDAGLNIIEELLVFMDQQFRAGSLDRTTLVRTAGTLADVMRQWEQELRRSTSRMGLF